MARTTVAKTTQPKKNARKPHATNEGNEPMVQSKANGKKKATIGEGSRQSKGKRKAGNVLVEQSNNDQIEAEASGGNATGKACSKKKVTFVEPTKARGKKKVTFVEPTKADSKKKVTSVVTFVLPEDLLSDDELKQKYPDIGLQKWMTTKRNLELVSRLHANMAQELEVVGKGPVETEKQASRTQALKDQPSFVSRFNGLCKSLDEFIAIQMVEPRLDDMDNAGDKQRIASTITKRYTRATFKKGVAVDGAGTTTVGGGAAKPRVKK